MGKVVYGISDTWLGPHYVRRGETWAADDPVVAEHPAAFTDDPDAAGIVRRSGPRPAADAPVEQATAAPGEKRNLPRRPRQGAPE